MILRRLRCGISLRKSSTESTVITSYLSEQAYPVDVISSGSIVDVPRPVVPSTSFDMCSVCTALRSQAVCQKGPSRYHKHWLLVNLEWTTALHCHVCCFSIAFVNLLLEEDLLRRVQPVITRNLSNWHIDIHHDSPTDDLDRARAFVAAAPADCL